jgi:hypothetical protein
MLALKRKGISTNFLIDLEEIGIERKVGEGGFGEVRLGRWLG